MKEKRVFRRLKVWTGAPWAWLEGDVDDEWKIAYRLAPRDGRILICEIRIYPAEPKGDIGRWGGDGDRDAVIPDGGLTARLLRKARVGDDREMAEAIVRNSFRDPIMGRLLVQRGFDLAPQRSRGRGGNPLPLEQYALLAERYTHLVDEGSRSPVKQIAAEFGLETKTVRHRLHTARRKLGFIGDVKQGKSGGELTAAGRAVLARYRKLSRKANKK